MFLRKKSHNLFSKSIRLALKNIKGSVTTTEVTKRSNKPADVEETVVEDTFKPKKNAKMKKSNAD